MGREVFGLMVEEEEVDANRGERDLFVESEN